MNAQRSWPGETSARLKFEFFEFDEAICFAMTQSFISSLDGARMQFPSTQPEAIDVLPAVARKLLDAAERLPLYDNREFYSPELQMFVLEQVRQFCTEEFDALVNSIRESVGQWPYWVLVRGLRFDEGNRLFVALNRAFGELMARPYEKPRAQLVHYIQPGTDLKSARGGRESERLHTDTADWKKPVEFISMICVRPDREGGGRSRILDVDTARDEVRKELGKQTLQLLETEPVPWLLADYCGGGVDWRPVLSKSSICWRRYTIELAQKLEGIDLAPPMQWCLDDFENLITTTPRTAEFLMCENELLFSDNTRTIHSRTPISAGDASDRLMIRSWIRAS